jgi:F-type H+-transporting ATPase subunit delta
MANDAGVVATRYAHAFAAVASDKGLDLLAARQQLKDFADTFDGSAPLREVLMDPSIPASQKLGVLDGIAEKLGLLREVRNFLAIITDHQRLHELNVVLDAYDRVADVDLGVTEAEVSTVHALNEADRVGLESQVAKLAGTKVRIAYNLDATLLGGAVVKIGSTVYDGSVRTQLDRMKDALLSA